jgi:hypothetical protein
MGYRSDVMAAFYVKDAKHLPVLKLWVDENFPVGIFDKDIHWFKTGMVLRCESVKWYDSYEDVKAFDAAVDKYLELVKNSEEGADVPEFSYEYVRVGENYDDIETFYDGDACEYLLGVSREITFDGG